MRMAVAQVDPRAIWRFQAAVGGAGRVHVKASQRPGRWSDQFVWQCTRAADIDKVVTLLWPFLGDLKREQIVACRLKVASSRPAINRNRDKTHCPRGHALTGENLLLRRPVRGPNSGLMLRECRECSNALRRLRRREASNVSPLFEYALRHPASQVS